MALTGVAVGNLFSGSGVPGATQRGREELIAEHGNRSSHNSPGVVAGLSQAQTFASYAHLAAVAMTTISLCPADTA